MSASPEPSGLSLHEVSFSYGSRFVLSRVSLITPPGAFVALLGPSGCGKSTLLKLIAGFLRPSAGRVHLAGTDVTVWPPERRNVGMVFQNYALFPHLTARRNVAFGLEVRGVPRAECHRRVEAMLDRVGLAAAEWDRLPNQLSGGQQQRVALARALVIEPRVLLLDEPLANLDRRLREQLRGELRDLQRRTVVSTVLVTHDQEEALALADLVGVMVEGRLLQVGTPREVYDRPRTPFVARFLGDTNLIPTEDGRLLMARPERCVTGPAAVGPLAWEGRVEQVTDLGTDVVVTVAARTGPERDTILRLRVRSRPGTLSVGVGDAIRVGVPENSAWTIPDRDDEGESVYRVSSVGQLKLSREAATAATPEPESR